MYIKIGGTGEQLPADAPAWTGVLDAATGLMWEANPSGKKYTWDGISLRAAEERAIGISLSKYTDQAWASSFFYGDYFHNHKEHERFVRLVRGGAFTEPV